MMDKEEYVKNLIDSELIELYNLCLEECKIRKFLY